MKYLFNSHPLQDESITIGLTKNMTVSFQLDLLQSESCLGYPDKIPLDFSTRGLYRWSQIYLIPIILVDVISTRTRYGVYQEHIQVTSQTHLLSTRAHYGVYRTFGNTLCKSWAFQLALTTECIEFGRDFRNALRSFNSHSLRSVSPIHLWNRWISYLSTRTHYGAYPSVSVVSLHPAPFNSHSLRSVSCCIRVW